MCLNLSVKDTVIGKQADLGGDAVGNVVDIKAEVQGTLWYT